MTIESKEVGLSFKGQVSAIRTSMGTFRVTIDLFEADLLTATKLPGYYQKSVQVALVQLPDEE